MHVLRRGAESRLNVLRYALHKLGYGAESQKPSRCNKIGIACIEIWIRVFSAVCDNFRHCEVFSKKFKNFWLARPRV